MLDVLVADDDESVLESVSAALTDAGHRVTGARDGAQAVTLLEAHAFDLAICDIRMPKIDGLTLMRRIRRETPGTAVVLMTSYGTIRDVVDSLRDGASDYVIKPFDPAAFEHDVVQPIARHRTLRKMFQDAHARLVESTVGAAFVADSPSMRRLLERLPPLASSEASVLVTGERGSGKELVARTLHAQGPRREGPFALLDCAHLPDVLAEAELAWISDNRVSRDAWFQEAAGGTLVLDGVEKLPPRTQVQLLRVLDESGTRARRDDHRAPSGVRLIALSRSELSDDVAQGHFLESLYYRLAGVRLRVPPLRDRHDDLCALVTLFLRELVAPATTLPGIAPGAWDLLAAHPFPGNVRELRWAIEHALAMAEGGPIEARHLPAEIGGGR